MIKFRFMNFISIILLCVSCNILLYKAKWHPRFKGVDPRVQTYAQEWFDLAAPYGLNFKHEVTIGFDNINRPNVVAQCEYGMGFREITIDSNYWDDMDSIDRFMTLAHEMGHCYCNERHQFGKDHIKYSDDGANPSEGFFKDSCPKSLMYPYTMAQICIHEHFSEYVDDLFQNCKPY